jgi:hypothetical protein
MSEFYSDHSEFEDINDDNILDTTSDYDQFNDIESNLKIKKFCEDFIFEREPIKTLYNMINDMNVEKIMGKDKYYIGYYIEKKRYLLLKKKFDNKINKDSSNTVNIDKNTLIDI